MKSTALLSLISALVFATSLIPHNLAQRAHEADQVALVQVLSSRIEKSDDQKFVKRVTKVLVGQRYKGSGEREIDIVQIGALDGLHDSRIPGDAEFKLGETALVFLKCSKDQNRCGLVAFSMGKIEIDGNSARVYDMFSNTWNTMRFNDVLNQLGVPMASGATR